MCNVASRLFEIYLSIDQALCGHGGGTNGGGIVAESQDPGFRGIDGP